MRSQKTSSSRLFTLFSVVAIAAAALLGLVPPAPSWVEAAYFQGAYPRVQAIVSRASNLTTAPLFDLVLLIGIVGAIAAGALVLRQVWRRRSLRPLRRPTVVTLTVCAILYLWFLGVWGLNYRRPPIEASVKDVSVERVTAEAVRRLAERAVDEANRLHAPAHAQGFAALDSVPPALLASLHDVERELGRPRPTVPTVPKRPLTTPYMRAAGVSGMLAPLFLETYLNPDLTGPERPYVLAHEWAHLSGFAPEDDASFLGFVVALRADVPSQYSAWLSLVSDAASQLPPATRQIVLEKLAEGPRRDEDAIRQRLRSRIDVIDRASWVAYDRAIKSQGARQGVAGYGRVVQLLIATGVIDRGGSLQ